MPAVNTADIVAASVSGVGTLLLVSLGGMLLAYYPRPSPASASTGAVQPILNQGFLKDLSRFSVQCVWTSTALFTLGTIAIEDVGELWALVAADTLNHMLGMALTGAICAWLRTDAQLTPALMASGAWCNSVALPIVLLLALCEQDALADIPDCAATSLRYLFVYTVPWTVGFFVVALPLLRASTSLGEGRAELHDDVPRKMQPGQSREDVAAMLRSWPPGVNLDQAPAAALALPPARSSSVRETFSRVRLSCGWGAWLDVVRKPPMLGTIGGVLIATWPWLQQGLFKGTGALRPLGLTIETFSAPTPLVFTLIMAASLVPPPRPSWPGTPAGPADPFVKTALALSFGRLVLIPAAGFAVVGTLMSRGADVLPHDKLGTLVILLEFATPSAQMPIVRYRPCILTDKSRPRGGFIPAEILVQNGNAGDNGTAGGTLN